jgi:hypothetical protein
MHVYTYIYIYIFQNYVFTQIFAFLLSHNNKKRHLKVSACTSHYIVKITKQIHILCHIFVRHVNKKNYTYIFSYALLNF